MKISYNWLKEYISVDLQPDAVSKILTDIGLEVEGLSQMESIKGGLEGVVIGEVKEVTQHPNADRLKLTKVDVGHSDDLSIVCGAPNVAKGQKVVVALVGATLYPNEQGFKIKKSKLRGELSEGMLCAEDELGLGKSHEGIMVLDDQAKVGSAAADYFQLKSDTIFDIGLTPNRADATSHYGVARDLAAFLNLTEEVKAQKPDVSRFKVDQSLNNIQVSVENTDACPRYSGICITNVEVKESPEWLKYRLQSIGIKPTNNVVDVTNFVLHELGQPLHAFDADQIDGDQVIVKTLADGSSFTTLDKQDRKLSNEDLMICNAKEGMCIAGVFGGLKSGVNQETKNIFLESAYFNPVWVRKTAKRHTLNTDASFRYERGADPNITVFALKRAAMLIKEVSGGIISSDIIDIYPDPIEDNLIELNFDKLDEVVGGHVDRSTAVSIVESLEMEILDQNKKRLRLKVPAYRVDVRREIDVIEDILRIYGYNNIKLPSQMRSSLITEMGLNKHAVENSIANFLSNNGFYELLNNSLSNPNYYGNQDDLVRMLNPLSKETEVMRKSMLNGGLETIAYNQNRKRKNLRLYEFGKTYRLNKDQESFIEENKLALWMSGETHEESWNETLKELDFYAIKKIAEACLSRLGIRKWKEKNSENEDYVECLDYIKGEQSILTIARVHPIKQKQFDIREDVYYAEFNWDIIHEYATTREIQYKAVPKFPEVRRDLALLIDQNVEFSAIKGIAKETEKKILKKVNLFDVYEGKNLESGKKSYGVSFTFQDEQKTLTDQHIDKVMERLINALKKDLNAELR